MPETENVRVAVRVRPFNPREKHRNARRIVGMEGNTTVLYNPDGDDTPKKFTYDRSYWSHDGFTEAENGLCVEDDNHPNGKKYVDQEKLYNDLGRSLLHNAWSGYNAALFAYGQTGSGKSYSLVGYGNNKGIVPRFCEDIFQTIENRTKSGDKTVVEVTFSMLEIYNEVVRDLLNLNDKKNKNKGLKVREHPTKGFFAEGLKSFLVTSAKQMLDKLEEGTTSRSIAATNMNETSSRAHTIIIINIVQKARNANGQETAKSSSINLVDLAGSERLSQTQATGDRLKEGASINQSLSCVGNCIHALAEKTNGKNIRVPYRDSVLTRLLMNALGGNSKTVMLATISPADINYDETLSTLRYADRAKQIRNHAKINDDPTDMLVKQLKAENEKLKQLMERGDVNGNLQAVGALSPDAMEEAKKKWEEEMKAAMQENERQLIEMRKTYEERLQQQQLEQEQQKQEQEKNVTNKALHVEDRDKIEEEKLNNPYLSNLNFDEQLSGKIIHIIRQGNNMLGKADECAMIILGPAIHDHHAIIHRAERDKIVLEKCSEDCRVLLNGDPVTNKVLLNHNDRILFGTSQLFVFVHQQQKTKSKMTYADVTFELAQEEIATKAGFELNNDDQTMEQALMNKDLLETIPAVEEANAISEELEKNVRFEIILVSPQFLGKNGDRTEVFIKVRNIEAGQEFEWTKEKFFDRLYMMKEMYQNYETGEEDWDLPPERDPFMEDPNTHCHIGSVQVYLQSLAFLVELKEQLSITDYTGQEVGIINVEVVPCNELGNEYDERDDVYVDSPQELIGKIIHFVVKVNGSRGLPARFTDVYVKYRVFLDEEDTKTEEIAETSNPDFNHKKMFAFNPVTQQVINYLRDGYINMQVWGKQNVRFSLSKQSGRHTKQLLQEELDKHGNELMNGFKMNGRIVDPNKQSIIVELLLMKKQQTRQHMRIENIRRAIESAEQFRMKKISVQLIKDLLFTTTPEMAEALIAQVPNDDQYAAVRSSTCSVM